jgi:exopolysaccharide biosynthesis polyprenyl glycosylphosphotransferase
MPLERLRRAMSRTGGEHAVAPERAGLDQAAPEQTHVDPPGPRAPVWPGAVGQGLALADWAVVAALLAAALPPQTPVLELPVALALQILAIGLSLKIGLWFAGAYGSATRGEGHWSAAFGVGLAALGAWTLINGPTFAARQDGLLALLALGAPATLALHLTVRWAVQASHRAGDWAQTAIIVGATPAAKRFISAHRDGRKLKVLAVFDDRLSRAPAAIEGAPVLGDVEALLSWPLLPQIDHIVLTVTPAAEARVRDLIARLRLAPNQVSLLLDFEGWSPELGGVHRLANGAAALILSGRPKPDGFVFAKRAQDLLISVALLAVFSPVMAIIAIGVKLDSRGPILFKQRRHGLNNKIITIWKFRTMRPAPQPTDRIEQVKADDPRVTRFGRFLRASSLDELPQLFNVIAGDMSLVGPRPHALGMRTGSVETCRIVADYAHRHRLKPGISGWAQINGSRGPVHSEEEVRERVRLDLEYIERASFWFDIMILLRTAPALLGDKLRIR